MLGFSTSAYYDWLKTKEVRDNKQKEYEAAITKIFTDSGEPMVLIVSVDSSGGKDTQHRTNGFPTS